MRYRDRRRVDELLRKLGPRELAAVAALSSRRAMDGLLAGEPTGAKRDAEAIGAAAGEMAAQNAGAYRRYATLVRRSGDVLRGTLHRVPFIGLSALVVDLAGDASRAYGLAAELTEGACEMLRVADTASRDLPDDVLAEVFDPAPRPDLGELADQLTESARFLRRRSNGLAEMQTAAREFLDNSLRALRTSVSSIAVDLGRDASMIIPKALLEILETIGIAFDAEAAYDGSEMDYDMDKVGDAYRAKLLDVIHAAQRGDPTAYAAAQGVHGEAKQVADSADSSESEREAAQEVMKIARRLMDATRPAGAG